MTALMLFAKTRRWGVAFAVFAVCAALVVACGPLSYSLNPRGGIQITAASQIPVIAAVVIQATMAPSFGQQERQAARNLVPWRLFHVTALTVAAAVLLGLAAIALDPARVGLTHGATIVGPAALIRNLLAFTGAGLVGSVLFSESFAWILPLAWSILPFVALHSPTADPSGLLTLASQPDAAFLPLMVAAGVWLLGTLLSANKHGRPL